MMPTRDVQAVGADQGEEGGEEAAALRRRALGDQHGRTRRARSPTKLMPSSAGDRQPRLRRPRPAPRSIASMREAVGDRGDQQDRGVERDQRQLEDLARGRPAGIAGAEHAEGGEQRREDQRVAHQVDPEAEQGRAGRCAVVVVVLLDQVEGRGRRLACGWLSAVVAIDQASRRQQRRCALASVRATSSAGM